MKLSSILLNLANLKQRIDQLAYNYGLIADYVVEYGTSGIWTYRKWASGIAECWGTTAGQNVSITQSWGNIYSAGDNYISATYPTGLFNGVPPTCSCFIIGGTSSVIPCYRDEGSATTTPQVQFVRGTSGTANIKIKFSAKGLWKNMGGVIKALFYKLFPVRGCYA